MTDSSPYIFLPYQQRWVEDKSSLKVCEKGRRIGITWAEAGDGVLVAATPGRAGMDVLYIGYNEKMTREFIDTCAWWARHFQVAASEIQQSLYEGEDALLAFSIRFVSGYEIMALSSAPRNLRGKQGRIVIDEAAFHDNLMSLLKAAIAMKVWGGETRVISTHDGVDNDFNLLLEQVRSGKRPGSVHKYTFDDAIADGLTQRIFYMLGEEYSDSAAVEWRQGIIDEYGDDADEELFCIPSRSGGAYLSVGIIEQSMKPAPIVRLEQAEEFTWAEDSIRESTITDWCDRELLPLLARLPKTCIHTLGQDFGRTGDLTVLAPITVQQNLIRTCPWLVEMRNVPFAQQRQVLWYILDKLPRLGKVAMDATGNGQQLAEETAQRYGKSIIEQVKFTEQRYLELMPPFKAALQEHRLIIPQDSDVRDDLRAIEVANGIPKLAKMKTGKKKNRHGDAAIALVLGYHASRQGYKLYDYKSSDAIGRTDYRSVKTTAGFKARKGIW